MNTIETQRQELMEKLREDGMYLEKIPDALLTEEMCEIAIEENYSALQFVPKDMLTENMCLIAMIAYLFDKAAIETAESEDDQGTIESATWWLEHHATTNTLKDLEDLNLEASWEKPCASGLTQLWNDHEDENEPNFMEYSISPEGAKALCQCIANVTEGFQQEIPGSPERLGVFISMYHVYSNEDGDLPEDADPEMDRGSVEDDFECDVIASESGDTGKIIVTHDGVKIFGYDKRHVLGDSEATVSKEILDKIAAHVEPERDRIPEP